jgi:DNA-binding NarL/FixJ family response regulator
MPPRCLADPIAPASPAPVTLRILIADDHDLICAGLERLISAQPGMEVCAIATDGIEALAKAKSHKPQVAIIDMLMSGLNGLETTREIRAKLPDCEVLLFTAVETDDLMREAFVSGAKSFILKTDAREHLLDAIHALGQHKPYFTNKVSEVIFARLLGGSRNPEPHPGIPMGRLTAHELEIVRRLALGDSNRTLALKLGVNLRTAEGHRAALMRKMNFESLSDLVRYAVRNQIIAL